MNEFNALLKDLRKCQIVDDFEAILGPWKRILECQEVTGAFIHAALLSLSAFLRVGLFTDAMSPLNKVFVQELMFSVANSRFETTVLESDEVVMDELIDFMLEVIKVSCTGGFNLVGDSFIFQYYDLLFVVLNQTRFSELLRAKATETAANLSAFLFSLSSNLEGIEDPAGGSKITYPNVVKIERSASTVGGPKASPTASNSTAEFVELVAEERPSSEPEKPVTPEESAVADPFEVKPDDKPFNPFEREDEQELAPGVIEEVMRLRARMAGITLDESPSDTSGTNGFDTFSGNCLVEVICFMARSIDCIEAPPKKAPGSIKAEPAPAKSIPSPKTQAAALKCLLAIFTDPSSQFSSGIDAPNQLEEDLLNLIGDLLLKNLLAILALDQSSRHLSAVSQLLISIFTSFRSHLLAQFDFFLSICLSIISNKGRVGGSVVVNSGKAASLPRPTQLALTTVCLEMLAYVSFLKTWFLFHSIYNFLIDLPV